jgi:hypothetical protein
LPTVRDAGGPLATLSCDRTARQYYGKYSGQVLEFDDELPEDAALRGEIRVMVPGILEEDPDGNPRPLQVAAKPSFLPGFFFIPEPGQKVWIEFVAGDIDFPIWTGIWYPDDKSPGTIKSERPTRFQKVIRTACGHVVQLDDTDGKEAVTVAHKGGAQIKIDENGSLLLANQNNAFLFLNAKDGETTLSDEHGCFLTLKEDGAIVASKDGSTFVEIKDGKAKVVAKDAVQLVAKEVVLECASIALGSGADQPAVLGNDLMQFLLGHMHPSAMGPTGPPTPGVPILFAPAPVGKGLSSVVKVK